MEFASLIFKRLSFNLRANMLLHVLPVCPELLKICSSLTKSYAVIWPRCDIQFIMVLPIIFPKTNWANQVVAQFRQSHKITTRALMPRCWVFRLIPFNLVVAHMIIHFIN